MKKNSPVPQDKRQKQAIMSGPAPQNNDEAK
jgi:hypothetical protein